MAKDKPDFLLFVHLALDREREKYYSMYYEVNMNDQITTARLPADTRNKLLTLSRVKHKTKSDIIKDSLDFYYAHEEAGLDSFTVGEPYFGNYGSGESDRAGTYKERIKEKLRGKFNTD
jgi:hypothetical protein